MPHICLEPLCVMRLKNFLNQNGKNIWFGVKNKKRLEFNRRAFFVDLEISNLFFAPTLFVNVEIIEDI